MLVRISDPFSVDGFPFTVPAIPILFSHGLQVPFSKKGPISINLSGPSWRLQPEKSGEKAFTWRNLPAAKLCAALQKESIPISPSITDFPISKEILPLKTPSRSLQTGPRRGHSGKF